MSRTRTLQALGACMTIAGFILTGPPVSWAAGLTWTFETDAAGQPPKGFVFGTTGSGQPGQWIVRAEADAPSGAQVLAQVSTDRTDDRFPVAAVMMPLVRDGLVSVRCKMVAGEVDQACGLVVRYQDENSYYVTRANALEGNIRLYHVVEGRRGQFAGWNGPVTSGTWHELSLEARGAQFTVSWDGQEVIDAQDTTFLGPGKVGVWTKADSVTYFDNLHVDR